MVTLIGLGGGNAGGLTAEALQALEKAEILVGAQRLLEAVPASHAEKISEYHPDEILSVIRGHADKLIAVVYSGDTGFYSGASKLIVRLEQEKIPYKVCPGLSSVQIFAARLGLPWQDWRLCSAHGTECDPVREVLNGQDTFFLTGGKTSPATLCRALTDAGLGGLSAAAGEELTYPEEKIRFGTAAQLAEETFAPLSVLLIRQMSAEDTKSGTEAGKRLMISAMSSGSGKTVLTCGLLAALSGRGVSCEAFKCGPDYIDPMFHTRVLGIPSRNLDIFLQGFGGVRRTLASQKSSLALLEGAMGFYDGVAGTTDASAWEIAMSQDIPVILAVKPGGSSVTLAAQIRGLIGFRRPCPVAGVILTACRPSLYEHLRPVLERETGLPVLGYLPPMEEAELESRHLGLLTAGEITDFQKRFAAVARQLEKTVDLDRLLALAGTAETEPAPETSAAPVCTVAVARDEAFCFYYQDSLDALESAGAELKYFSPLHDAELPACDALYLGGGYPELYAASLAENRSMRACIARAVQNGLPTLAECGGFLYLQQTMEDSEGIKHDAAGVLPGDGFKTDRLQRFGYAWLKPETDSMLFRAGETVPVHEFHYWDCTENGTDLAVEKPNGQNRRCGYVSPVLYAAFPHLHLGGELPLAERFVAAAKKEKRS